MPRYIDADRLIQSIQFMSDMCPDDNIRFVCADIAILVEEQPTADVVEAVRCKDCKWFDDGFCMNPQWYIEFPPDVIDDDFCSFGERKEKTDETN